MRVFQRLSCDCIKCPLSEVSSWLSLFRVLFSSLSELRQRASLTLCFSAFFGPDAVTEVKTDIYVTSFGPVSDTDMVSIIPAKVKVKDDVTDPRKQIGVFLQQGFIAMFCGGLVSDKFLPSPSRIQPNPSLARLTPSVHI